MESQGQQNPVATLTQIVMVMLLSAGALLLPPLVSERPKPSGQGVHVNGVQDVEARLWQDPFGVVDKARKAEAKQLSECRPGLAPCQPRKRDLSWLSDRIDEKGARLTTVVYALIQASGAVGADEARRRQRYAVLAGMNVAGYVPRDPEHIGYVEETIQGSLLITPFEWLDSKPGASQAQVLLIWVDEQALGLVIEGNSDQSPGPLARLSKLHAGLTSHLKNLKIQPVILGPASSSFLRQAVNELCRSDTALETLRKIPWYSPYATLPEDELRLDGCNSRHNQPATKTWKDEMPKFKRLIPSDNEVLDKLVGELRQRHVDAKGVVALVGQWDTVYSQHLEQHLKDALPEAGIKHVITASYLRGLDGKTPGAGGESDAAKKGDKADSYDLERPEGDAQQDYLRRLAANIRARAADRPVTAVGVLGDDYHDKLLVLEALRPEFPQAVFFTTEVDAAMLHPKDNKVTRNLVVASGYGLELAAELQQDIPPFRDSYQSAAFLATQLALQETAPGSSAAATDISHWLLPQIFEIGRTMPIALKPTAMNQCKSIQDCMDPHPATLPPPSWYFMWLPPAALLLVMLVSAGVGLVHRVSVCIWGTLIGLTLLAAWLLVVSQHQAVVEPLEWFQGISVWPSEVIRLLAAALSIYYIWFGLQQIGQTNLALSKRYRLDDQTSRHMAAPDLPQEGIAARFKTWARCRYHQAMHEFDVMPGHLFRTCALHKKTEASGDIARNDKIETLFHRYQNTEPDSKLPWILRWPAWERGLLILGIYLVASLVIFRLGMHMEMPSAPLRGNFAYWADKTILFVSVLSFLSLLFFTLDRVARAIWLSRALLGCTVWPSAMIDQYRNISQPKRRHKSIAEITRIHQAEECNIQRIYSDWLDTQFIADITEPIQRIVFYPFVVLTLMILARTQIFDGWAIPPILIAIFGIILLLVVMAALRLRITAERVRAQAQHWLNRHLMDARAANKGELVQQIELMLRQVKELQVGAFAPFGQQPLFHAALTVLGSLSGIKLLEYVNSVNF